MVADGSIANNPFAVLTIIVGPAVLTNACSVLSLGTANRLARVVDRTRIVVSEMALAGPAAQESAWIKEQLRGLDVRANVLLQALRSFYAALGLFATAALLSALGGILTMYGRQPAFETVAIAALVTGSVAVASLVYGCFRMVYETRLAVRYLTAEASMRVGYRTSPPV